MIKHAWILALGLLALVLGVLLSQALNNPSKNLPNTHSTFIEPAKPLPPFNLVSASGGVVDNKSLEGHWTFLFFGFTYCPDICPTTLATMRHLVDRAQLRADLSVPEVLFVSVDPERDALEKLDKYVKYFNEDFKAATGSHDALRQLASPLGILYARVDTSATGSAAGHYLVDHSASILLLNPKGQLQAVFGLPHNVQIMLEDLEKIQKHYTP